MSIWVLFMFCLISRARFGCCSEDALVLGSIFLSSSLVLRFGRACGAGWDERVRRVHDLFLRVMKL